MFCEAEASRKLKLAPHLLLISVLSAGAVICGEASRNSVRIDVSMILVPVTVTDAMDHPVIDLPRESFRVF